MSTNPEKRNGAGQFAPGVSGNPGGRPKGIAAKARELCGDDGELLAQFWLDAMNNTEEPMTARLKASELLVERGYGKAPSFVPIGEEDPLGLKEDIDRGIDSIMDELAVRRQVKAVRPSPNGSVEKTSPNGSASS